MISYLLAVLFLQSVCVSGLVVRRAVATPAPVPYTSPDMVNTDQVLFLSDDILIYSLAKFVCSMHLQAPLD
jgi:hypothetical protein